MNVRKSIEKKLFPPLSKMDRDEKEEEEEEEEGGGGGGGGERPLGGFCESSASTRDAHVSRDLGICLVLRDFDRRAYI